MRINTVERITGLTSKAIRLYESKGLLRVAREENGYRNYTEDDVIVLKKIKQLRSVGVSIADIKLYLFGVVNIGELMDQRKMEIRKESGIRKNMVLQKMLEDQTGMPVAIHSTAEEAATGAALFSALVAGKIEYRNGFSEYIRYNSESIC